ncbi:MAG: hypothetical protein K1W33_09105 [Clostridia bacterium]
MRKLKLLHLFLERISLINRQIIKYAILSLKYQFIDGQPIEQHNNPIDKRYSSEELVIGAYEADYCTEFLKLVRTEFLQKFFKENGEFDVVLLFTQTFELHERLFCFVLEQCQFKYHYTVENNGNVTYHIY